MAKEIEEDFEGDDAEFEKPAGANRKKLLLFVAAPLVLVLVLAGGGFAYYKYISHKDAESAATAGADMTADAAGGTGPAKDGAKSDKGADASQAAAVNGAVFYDLPEMLVNIDTSGRKRSFLKLTLSVELADEADVPKVENVVPKIVDNFQIYLRGLKADDLDGAAGAFRIREELLTRINAAVRPVQVRDVLFKEMIVQ